MSPQPEQADVPRSPATGTFGFQRKVQVREYESAEASIFIQFDVDTDNIDATISNAKEAAFAAKTVIFEQLGIEFSIDEGGVLREVLKKHFGTVTDVTSQQNANNGAQPQQAAQPSNGGTQCPKCNGDMWDNRNRKTNPKAPDFKCKDKSCDGVIWPPRGN